MIENLGERAQKIVTIYDDIYNLPDCRGFWRIMDQHNFRTAHHSAHAFRATRAEMMRVRKMDRLNIMDFASGYGIATLLMRFDIDLDEVLDRYRDPKFDTATTEQVIKWDRAWLSALPKLSGDDAHAAIDIANHALDYGRSVGIFDTTFAENLQADEASVDLQTWMSGVDLIVESGSVAHMMPQALDRVLNAAHGRKPWVITAPIRGNDTAEAIEVMQDHGLVVEILDVPPYRHRRFVKDGEQARATVNAQERGHDTEGVETSGYFHAQLYLARPENELTPVSDWPMSPRTD